MAACTFALSPSSANVVVCKRKFLRLSRSCASTRAARRGAKKPASESAGGFGTKGLTGKHQSFGKWLYKSNPLRPYRRVHGTVLGQLQGKPNGLIQYAARSGARRPRRR